MLLLFHPRVPAPPHRLLDLAGDRESLALPVALTGVAVAYRGSALGVETGRRALLGR
jgi:hypothetical protein